MTTFASKGEFKFIYTRESEDISDLTAPFRQVRGDGDPVCFDKVEDTGIPEIQNWCRELTVSSRDRSARLFLAGTKSFATGVRQFLKGGEGVTPADRAMLRDKFETVFPAEDLAGGLSDEEDEEMMGYDSDDSEDPYGNMMYDDYGGFISSRAMGGIPGMAKKKKEKESKMKRDKDGNLIGITAQLATVSATFYFFKGL